MADLLIRDLDDRVKAALREQATRNGRSMSSEIKFILKSAVQVKRERNALAVVDEIFSPELRFTAKESAVFEQAIDSIGGEVAELDFD